MTNDERAWWSPEALTERESEVRTGSSDDADDLRNDFASYRALARGGDPQSSGLHLHNEVEPWRIDTVCRDYKVIVRRTLGRLPTSVADLGCGAGFTTDGLHRTWPDAIVTGFDVSHDAVRYARNRWVACTFVEGAITPDEILGGAPFDVIVCQEFYPFSRTDSVSAHATWLEMLRRSLSQRGVALILVWSGTNNSINDSYRSIQCQFHVTRYLLPAPRIAVKIHPLFSGLAGRLLHLVRRDWVFSLYVLQRQ